MGPKTVDQLRAANNPKMSFKSQMLGGHVGRRGPRGIIGKQEKNRPDTYYIKVLIDGWLQPVLKVFKPQEWTIY